MNHLTSRQIEFIESRLPGAAAEVFAHAKEKTLASGLSVLISKDGSIYCQTPDGSLVFVKKIDPPVHVGRGLKFMVP